EPKLTRQAGSIIAVGGAIEKIVFIFAYLWQAVAEFRVDDMNMAGRARARPAAQCQDIVETRLADYLHDRQAGLPLDLVFLSITGHNNQSRHSNIPFIRSSK